MSAQRPSRGEWIALGTILLVGVVLRLAWLDRLAVEHFDEGVYASNFWFGPRENYQYPNRHLYSPPLVPFLIETIFHVFGPSNLGAMAVSLLAGCLTVPLVWWVGRRWFNPLAGLLAATLCATSSLHILLSRTGLVDALLGAFLLLAVWLLTEAFGRRNGFLALAGGVATGLAWWTKYNGWLPLAISSAGLALWWLSRRAKLPLSKEGPEGADDQGPPLVHTLFLWLLAAAVAFAVWSPVLVDLQDQGGYAAVMANHRQYIVGWRGWWDSLLTIRHSWSERSTGSALPLIRAIPLLMAWIACDPGRFTWNGNAPFPSVASWGTGLASAFVLAYVAGFPIGLLVLTVIGLQKLMSRSPAPAILLAWVVGLLVVTPLYRPYPRLALPLEMALWISAGAGGSRLLGARSEPNGRPSVPDAAIVAIGLVLFLITARSAWQSAAPLPTQIDRRGIVEVARMIAVKARAQSQGKDLAVYVYGEPALVFQLRLLGLPAVQPVEHLAFARNEQPTPHVPTFVVIGPHARKSAGFERQFSLAQDRLTLVERTAWHASPVVTMDQQDLPGGEPFGQVSLYQVH